jgi:DnaK suppressor protein
VLRRSLWAAPLVPKPISQCGDLRLFDVVSAMSGLCVEVRLPGMLKRLPGAFMSGQVIFLSAVLRAGAMSMRGEAMLLGSYLLRFAHDPYRCTYGTVSRGGQAEALRAPARSPDRQIPHFKCSLCTSRRGGIRNLRVPVLGYSRAGDRNLSDRRKKAAMATALTGMGGGFQKILERKAAELARMLRTRDGIAIEKSADPMDEIQYASERDLAICNVDRDSAVLREVKAALRRVSAATLGTCIDCQSPIGQKRLAAVPWASRCIRCQETADRDGQDEAGPSEALDHAA